MVTDFPAKDTGDEAEVVADAGFAVGEAAGWTVGDGLGGEVVVGLAVGLVVVPEVQAKSGIRTRQRAVTSNLLTTHLL